MEDDIQNHLSTVMFRGTPCIINGMDRIYSNVDVVLMTTFSLKRLC